jgi:glycine/D-amino acid oxidase-like deaminating enzyme
LTTLAIIGGGIAGRSLLYALSSEKFSFSKVFLFDSLPFSSSCSLNSTGIVAPRGVTPGHSPLGDLLIQGLDCFRTHVEGDSPVGVYPITQYTSAVTRLDQFRTRYPAGAFMRTAGPLKFQDEFYLATEDAFMIDPALYLPWLLEEAQKNLPLTVINEFVTHLEGNLVRTVNGTELSADHIIVAGGAASRFWKTPGLPVQGSYLEFGNASLDAPSFSLTLEGDNLIYHAHTRKLLMGSTTSDDIHQLAPIPKLKVIHRNLKARVALDLPEYEEATVRVGLREKAPKRMPYLKREGAKTFFGGFYKNGYSLPLLMAKQIIKTLE